MIGGWLWAMRQARKRTLYLVEDLDEDILDWQGPDGRENSIGTLRPLLLDRSGAGRDRRNSRRPGRKRTPQSRNQ